MSSDFDKNRSPSPNFLDQRSDCLADGKLYTGSQQEGQDTDGILSLDTNAHQTQIDPSDGKVARGPPTQVPRSRERLEKDHLRLVRVQPGTREWFVHCESCIVPVSVSPKYIAVSYAWGPPIAVHAIFLDGRKHLVPKNLLLFLLIWRFRLEYGDQLEAQQRWDPGTQWLWIDALSIDQTDVQERMHQVRIMSRIFGEAEEVLVWLGLANEEVDDLMYYVFTGYVRQGRQMPLAGLIDLCARSYWTRLWIYQELVSAKDVVLMCGSHEGSHILRWEDFQRTFREAVRSEDNPGFNLLTSIWAESRYLRHSPASKMVDLRGDTAPTSLWLLLQLTSHLNCYDPRDKIYALLGIAKSGCDGIHADYEMPPRRLIDCVLDAIYAPHESRSSPDVAIRRARLQAIMGV